jgi:hypothetical protein
MDPFSRAAASAGHVQPRTAPSANGARAAIGGVAFLALVAAVAGCIGGGGRPSPPFVPLGPASAGSSRASPQVAASADPAHLLQVVVVSTSHWPGPNRILLALEDAANAPIGGAAVAVSVSFGPPSGANATVGPGSSWPNAENGIALEARFVRYPGGGRGLYEVDALLPRIGTWHLRAEARIDGGPTLVGTATLTVRDPGRTIPLGAPAPRIATPTARDVNGDLRQLTTDPIPERSFYWLSEAEALDAGQPFLFLIDSFAFRPTLACGGGLAIARHVAPAFPLVDVIHVEPYRTRFVDGRLVLDAPDGSPVLAPWALAWGLGVSPWDAGSVPWVFVVDAHGRVAGKFQGVFGTDELRAALAAVSPWVPSG